MSCKMQEICDLAKTMLSATYLKLHSTDDIASSVEIIGSHDLKQDWKFGILQNSRYFIFFISPVNARYYTPGSQVKVELCSSGLKIKKPFRRFTTTPEKALQRIQDWIEKTKYDD